uniref:Uncharacterized protein n=1 Tax=Physcomitrium patens TaxID=3218 RepID=A0A2K1JU53_PHYPA|nr:hypothetical protein PHYPA_014829 [Physcomitrium patens]
MSLESHEAGCVTDKLVGSFQVNEGRATHSWHLHVIFRGEKKGRLA